MPRQAMLAIGRSRVALGQDLRLTEVLHDQLWLEGWMRLRPGQAVDLVGQWPGVEALGTRARIVTWRVVRLTASGPYYRGCCRLER